MRGTDVLIVGAGPIGLEVAAGLKRAGVEYVQIEAGQVGATFGWWAPQTRFFSSPERLAICGVPIPSVDQGKITGEEYQAYLREIVRQFGLEVRRYRRVVGARREGDAFVVRSERSTHGVGGVEEPERDRGLRSPATDGAEEYRARRVVLAIGNMHRPRMLGVAGEGLAHASHYFEGPHKYFGTRVLIVGGKNSAVEAALRCWRAGARVTVSYRGERFDEQRVKYWLRPEIEWLIEKGEIGWLPRTIVREIRPGLVVLGDAGGRGVPTEVETDFVLLMTGYVQDPSLFEAFGVALEGPERRPAHDARTMETNVPGVYVAGTACGGSQERTRYFIENTHVHADRIVRAITGTGGASEEPEFGPLEES
ncbi:MAG TPA: NAD(P)-binding domain-containing protein [Phycisphaerales bacterium]|nr:NAD(P)-binding domain-containing protein [Phycisphaerales bacterium]